MSPVTKGSGNWKVKLKAPGGWALFASLLHANIIWKTYQNRLVCKSRPTFRLHIFRANLRKSEKKKPKNGTSVV